MYYLETFLSMVESLIDTSRKRHITGGVLISLSALFAGLAVTTLTSKNEEKEFDNEHKNYI